MGRPKGWTIDTVSFYVATSRWGSIINKAEVTAAAPELSTRPWKLAKGIGMTYFERWGTPAR
jgi:hypothetical protein